MTITSTNPSSGTVVEEGAVLTIASSVALQTLIYRRDGYSDENIFVSGSGGWQAGYTGSSSGGVYTVRRNQGWDASPFQIVADDGATETTLEFYVVMAGEYPVHMRPWGSGGPGGGSGTINKLDDIGDVNAPAPDDLDVLSFDDATQDWIPRPPGTPGPHNLESHSNVTITAPQLDEVLTYNGAIWVNQEAQGGTTVGGSDDVPNDSGVTGATVTDALDNLATTTGVNAAAIALHEATLAEHGLPAIPGGSSGKGLRVKGTNDGYELFDIGAGTGDVTFTASTVVDNQIARFDTSGNAIQGGASGPTIDDAGAMFVGEIEASGTIANTVGSNSGMVSDAYVAAKTWVGAEGLYFPERSAALLPGATSGFGQIYYKNTGDWVGVDEAGVETIFGAGAGAGTDFRPGLGVWGFDGTSTSGPGLGSGGFRVNNAVWVFVDTIFLHKTSAGGLLHAATIPSLENQQLVLSLDGEQSSTWNVGAIVDSGPYFTISVTLNSTVTAPNGGQLTAFVPIPVQPSGGAEVNNLASAVTWTTIPINGTTGLGTAAQATVGPDNGQLVAHDGDGIITLDDGTDLVELAPYGITPYAGNTAQFTIGGTIQTAAVDVSLLGMKSNHTTNPGGAVNVFGGNATSGTGDGGDVNISGGASTGGALGAVSIEGSSINLQGPLTTNSTIAGMDSDDFDAITGAASPSSGNVFATMADVAAGGGGDVSAANSPNIGEIARWTSANTIEGLTESEFKVAVNLEIGTDVAAQSHVGAGGAAHANATTGASGFMSAADKTKIDAIDSDDIAAITGATTPSGSNVFLTEVDLGTVADINSLLTDGPVSAFKTYADDTALQAAQGIPNQYGWRDSDKTLWRDSGSAWEQAGGIGGVSMRGSIGSYIFDDSTTTTSDPGTGNLRFNNTDVTAAGFTEIAISETDADGLNRVNANGETFLPLGSLLVFRKTSAPDSAFLCFIGATTDASGFKRYAVTAASSLSQTSTTWALPSDGESLEVTVIPPAGGALSMGGDITGTTAASVIAANAVETAMIANSQVTQAKIAINSVDVTRIDPTGGSATNLLGLDGGGDPAWLAQSALSITGPQIVSGDIDANRIPENAVTQHEGAIDHDNLAGWFANQHVPVNQSTYALRETSFPPASHTGELHFSTDSTPVLSRSNGTTWVEFEGGTGGGIAGPVTSTSRAIALWGDTTGDSLLDSNWDISVTGGLGTVASSVDGAAGLSCAAALSSGAAEHSSSAVGGIVYGRSSGAGALIQAGNYGAVAGGSTAAGGDIVASGVASFARGNPITTNAITASGIVSTAIGHGTQAVTASGIASFAMGTSFATPTVASANNCVQIGEGTNAEATSIGVGIPGSGGIRLIGDGAAAASPQNGDVHVAGGVVTVRSNGANVPIKRAPMSVTIEAPESGDVILMGRSDRTSVIANVHGVIDSGTSVVVSLDSGASRATSDQQHVNAQTASSTTTGTDLTKTASLTFDSGDWIWVTIGTVTGTVGSICITVSFV